KEADIALDRVPIKRLDPHVPASQCRRRKEVRGVRGIRLDLVIPRLVALPGGDTKALVAIALDMRAECIHYTRRYVDIWGCGGWASYPDLDILTHIWRDHQQRGEELTGFTASQPSRTAAQSTARHHDRQAIMLSGAAAFGAQGVQCRQQIAHWALAHTRIAIDGIAACPGNYRPAGSAPPYPLARPTAPLPRPAAARQRHAPPSDADPDRCRRPHP